MTANQKPARSAPLKADADLKIDKTVVLVGLMGAGKSAIGRRLAPRLGLLFVDADAEVEKAAGSSIEDIFERHGEVAFRDGERRVIARLLDAPPHVLAAGGGAFIDESTRALIAERAISVWLRADLDTLTDRVSRRSHRPLLNRGDPREILEELKEQRDPVYATADIVVESTSLQPAHTVDSVVAAVRSFVGAGKAAKAAGAKT